MAIQLLSRHDLEYGTFDVKMKQANSANMWLKNRKEYRNSVLGGVKI